MSKRVFQSILFGFHSAHCHIRREKNANPCSMNIILIREKVKLPHLQ